MFNNGNKKRGNIIYKKGMDLEHVIREAFDSRRQLRVQIKDLAYKLRKCILDSPHTPLPEDLRIADILKGEIVVPELLDEFVSTLVQGPDVRRGQTNSKKRRIESITNDLVYIVTGGNKKPKEQLMLGLALKKLTSSRKVIEILNRLGHCISYTAIEELETELTMQLNDDDRATPYGMKLDPNLTSGVAWDNYDRFVFTLNGKNTLHDTVGIAYQDIMECTSDTGPIDQTEIEGIQETSTTSTVVQRSLGLKRRRLYQARGLELEPYRKRPKISDPSFLPNDHACRNLVPQSLHMANLKDILWILSLKLIPNTPMWIGWNSFFHIPENRDKKQSVWYLPQINLSPTSYTVVAEALKRSLQINLSPTSYTVVAETLKRSLQIANESKRDSLCVTFDLAIAKMAIKIQQEESPTYDRLFINFGAFHMEMAFFHAIGKYIELSGGPEILSASEIISSDSLGGFISGTHFNRCKRIHPLLYAAFLHMEEFLSVSKPEFDFSSTYLSILVNQLISGNDPKQLPPDFSELFLAYNDYVDETKLGKHGLTAQYWMQYMTMIKLYHDLSRSVREGDLDLFISTIPKVSVYFFSFN